MDDSNLGLLFGLLVLFIACSAFFSASETGVMTANRYRLKHKAKLGDKNAQRILSLLSQPDRLIGVILVGNNTVNTLAATIATIIGQVLAQRYGISNDTSVGIAAGVLTFLLLILAKLAPKPLLPIIQNGLPILPRIFCLLYSKYYILLFGY